MLEKRKRIGDIKIDKHYHTAVVWLTLRQQEMYTIGQLIGNKTADAPTKDHYYHLFFNLPRGVVCSYLLDKIKIDGKQFRMMEMGGYPYREYTQIYIDFKLVSDAKRFINRLKKKNQYELFIFNIDDKYKDSITSLENIVKVEAL